MQVSQVESVSGATRSIRELGYVVIGSVDKEQWRRFGERILGLAATDDPGGALYLKMDERDYRMAIVPSDRNHLIASGWGVAGKEPFDALRTNLKLQGVETVAGTAKECRLRRVQEFFWFEDPAGNRQEVFWGPICAFKPFVSPAGVSGFVTGELGLGHVVLPAPDIEASFSFWKEKLGFGVSDLLTQSFGGQEVKLCFMHCDNRRQHSVALARMEVPHGCVHMMIEVKTLKDVGLVHDRVMDNNVQMVLTLGQHVNDDCLSFYFMCPGGFFFEVGWEGALKDWSRHVVFETTVGSHWGHRFVMNDPRYQSAALSTER